MTIIDLVLVALSCFTIYDFYKGYRDATDKAA